MIDSAFVPVLAALGKAPHLMASVALYVLRVYRTIPTSLQWQNLSANFGMDSLRTLIYLAEYDRAFFYRFEFSSSGDNSYGDNR
jgi:hypothetical protein